MAARPTSARPICRSTCRVARHFVVHADGNWSKSDDLRTGGHLLTKELREEAAASPFPEIQELADLKGELPNSAAKSWELAGGVAYVDGDLNVGVSVTHHDALYGVPIRFSLDPDIEAEAPTIDVKQTRYDARAEIPLSGFFSQVRLRGGYAKYRHDEIEDTGEVASTFHTKGGEGRPSWSRPSAMAGAAPAACNISSARCSSTARRNSFPKAASSRPACSPCRAWSGGLCALRAAAASNSAS